MSAPVMTTQKSWIEKTPDVCGGVACIRTTRIYVWGLVEWRRLVYATNRDAPQHHKLREWSKLRWENPLQRA